MRRSSKIASAQDCCRKQQHEWEAKQVLEQVEATVERVGEFFGYGSRNEADIEAEDEEKKKLLVCAIAGGADGVYHGRRCGTSSSLCRWPSRAAVASKALVTHHLKKLPTRNLRSCCEAAKKKFSIPFTMPLLCFTFGSQFEHSKESTTNIEEILACLMNVGIHVHTSILHSHRKFSLQELYMATSNFAEKNILGKGSSGCVYRGKLTSSGLTVAVKVLNMRLKDARFSFITELEIMCGVRNNHIQPLLGYCVELGHLLLVYAYMPGGSLETWLHGNKMKAGVWGMPRLSWKDRCKVAIHITKALHYLHTECQPPIIHRDFKASNILLDKHNDPKLTDFGLAIKASLPNIICKDIMGTFGYLAPEYFQSGKVSAKIDIYSLGIVLLELMTGRRPIDDNVPVGDGNLANWARHCICNTLSCTAGMADPALGTSYSSTRLQRQLYIAALCIHPFDAQRPSIEKVLAFMQGEPVVRLHRLVMEAYKDASFPVRYCLTLPSNHGNRESIKNEEDLRKHYLEMAMQDVEERSSSLHSPLIVL